MTGQVVAVVAALLLAAPGAALALALDLEQADAKRRTRDALRVRRERLRDRSWTYVQPPTFADRLQQLGASFRAFGRAVGASLLPALSAAAHAAAELEQAAERVRATMGKRP